MLALFRDIAERANQEDIPLISTDGFESYERVIGQVSGAGLYLWPGYQDTSEQSDREGGRRAVMGRKGDSSDFVGVDASYKGGELLRHAPVSGSECLHDSGIIQTWAGVSPVTFNLPGSGQTAKFLNDIFPSIGSPFQGVLRITTTSSGLSVVGLRTRVNERSDFLITTTSPVVESNPSITREWLFPHLADGGGYTTQFIPLCAKTRSY